MYVHQHGCERISCQTYIQTICACNACRALAWHANIVVHACHAICDTIGSCAQIVASAMKQLLPNNTGALQNRSEPPKKCEWRTQQNITDLTFGLNQLTINFANRKPHSPPVRLARVICVLVIVLGVVVVRRPTGDGIGISRGAAQPHLYTLQAHYLVCGFVHGNVLALSLLLNEPYLRLSVCLCVFL